MVFLRNPTRDEIIGTFDSLTKIIHKDDNLLIFYAGHGIWDKDRKQGYWLPRDAHSANRARWISNSDIKESIRAINSGHTLLIADACFSGGLLRSWEDSPTDIKALHSMPSRSAMTSGTLTTVPDESVFLEYLLKRLRQNTETYLSAQTLFSSLRNSVISNSKVVPQFGKIDETGDDGGDFIFVRKGSAIVASAETAAMSVVQTMVTNEKSREVPPGSFDYGYGPGDAGILKVGSQTWISKNLNVDVFANGDLIPEAKTAKEWRSAGNGERPAWCYYNNDPANGAKFGKLYNWYALNDPRGLVPKGWHVPSNEEWQVLVNHLGGDNTAGTALKSTSGWDGNGNGNNRGGISFHPGGYRWSGKDFESAGKMGVWWSTTEACVLRICAMARVLESDNGRASMSKDYTKDVGASVRCIRD